MHSRSLQQRRELEEAGAVAAFDEDGAVGDGGVGEGGLDLLDGGEDARGGGGDLGELGADKPEGVGSYGEGLLVDAAVLGLALGSQLAHVAEDEHLVGGMHVGEVVQGDRHAAGIGVVGIDDERVAVGAQELAAIVGGCVAADGLDNLVVADSEGAADGGGGAHVVGVVVAHEVGVELTLEDTHAHRGSVVGDSLAGEVGDEHEALAVRRHVAEVVAAEVDEGGTSVGGEPVVEFALGAHDTLESAEALEVGAADIGDESVVGLDDACERGYLAGVVGSRLDDRHRVLGAQAQEGEGHTDMVVEVALGVEDIMAPGEHGGTEFLGGRLAVGARDLQHAESSLAHRLTVGGGELLEGGEHVGDEDTAVVGGVRRLVDDGAYAAGFEGLGGKLIAVERLAPEGEEHHARLAPTRVGGDAF